MRRAYDTIIVGGGIIGASIAYFLTRSGQSVAVLERKTFASGTSGRCDGNLQIVDSKPGLPTEFAAASMEMFPQVVADLDCDVQYAKSGSLFVFETEQEVEAGKILAAEKKRSGIELQLLDAYEIRQLCRGLSERLVGGIYTACDAQVDPLRMTFGLMERARCRGADAYGFHEVTEIHREGNALVVSAGDDIFLAEKVVIAAGVWSPFLGQKLGIEIPIRPRQGQLLVTEEASGIAECTVTEYGYILTKYANSDFVRDVPAEVERNGVAMLVEPCHGRNMLIGSSRRFAGYDMRNDFATIHAIARRACDFFPGLRDMNMIRAYAGLRPYTPDQLPILSATDMEGLYIAAGHEGAGICLSLATGKFMNDLLLGVGPAFDPKRFALERFSEGGEKEA